MDTKIICFRFSANFIAFDIKIQHLNTKPDNTPPNSYIFQPSLIEN